MITESSNSKKRVVAIPYIHSVSHRLKKVASRYVVNVVFTAPNELGKIGAAEQRKKEHVKGKKITDICPVKHIKNNNFTDCRIGVVYKVPLSYNCGHFYVGQAGWCINKRLMERKRPLTGGSLSNLSLHCPDCQDCNGTPELDECAILYRHRHVDTRLMVEAWHINNGGSACLSQPSNTLHKEEINCLNSYLSRRPARIPD